jgi:Ni/Co efflux regulator RcnB
MKKLIVLSTVVISSLIFSSAKAQVRFSVNINIGAQPAWVANNDAADYYYLPDIESYYDVRDRVYVYREGNQWRRGAYLPARYRNYDFRNKHVISIKGQDRPYLHHEQNRNAYANANNRFNQQHGPQQRQDNRNDRHDNRNDRRDNDHRGNDNRRFDDRRSK